MPPDLKLRGWQTKTILRGTVRNLLPPATLRKRKQGFSVPLREWLRGELDEMVRDYLVASSSPLPAEVFNRPFVEHLCLEHRRAAADHSRAIWLLLMFAAWSDLYLHGHAPVGGAGGETACRQPVAGSVSAGAGAE